MSEDFSLNAREQKKLERLLSSDQIGRLSILARLLYVNLQQVVDAKGRDVEPPDLGDAEEGGAASALVSYSVDQACSREQSANVALAKRLQRWLLSPKGCVWDGTCLAAGTKKKAHECKGKVTPRRVRTSPVCALLCVKCLEHIKLKSYESALTTMGVH